MNTIESQIASVNNGGTFTFSADCNEPATISGGKHITIDLDGHTWASPDGVTPLTVNGADVIVRNGTIRSKGNACVRAGVKDSPYQSNITLDSDLDLVSEDFVCLFITRGATVDTSADMTANGEGACIQGNGAQPHWGNSCTIRGGVISAPNSTAIYWPQVGDLIVRGGDISGLTGIEVRAGSLLITGGNITSTATDVSFQPNGSGAVSKGVAVTVCQHTTSQPLSARITGGTFNGPRSFVETDIQNPGGSRDILLSIEGGTFKTAVEVASLTTPFISGGTFPHDMNAGSYFQSGLKYVYDEALGTITWYMPPRSGSPYGLSDLSIDGVVTSTAQGVLLGSGDSAPEAPVEGNVYYNTHDHKWFVYRDGGWASEDFDITEEGIVAGSSKPASSGSVHEMRQVIDGELESRYLKTEVDTKLKDKQDVIPSASAVYNLLNGPLTPNLMLRSDGDGRAVVSGLTEESIMATANGLATANDDITALTERVRTLEDVPQRQEVVKVANWTGITSDGTVGGSFPYRWKVTSADISEKDFAYVEFNDGTRPLMSTQCETFDGYLYLYSRVDTHNGSAFTPSIQTIILVKG